MTNQWPRTITAASVAALLISCSTTSTPAPTAAPAPIETTASAGETTTEQAAAASTDSSPEATVYIYRPKAFLGFALHPTMMLDGQDLINVENGTVWTGRFKPGRYAFLMDDERSGAELDLKAGETYYIKVEIVPGFWKGGGRATLMAKEQGSLEIKRLRALPKNEIEHPAFKNE